MVDLLAHHEKAYLEHCRKYAGASRAPEFIENLDNVYYLHK